MTAPFPSPTPSSPTPKPDTPAAVPVPTSGKIAGFTGWNLFGLCAPMLAAFYSFPILLEGLGKERFGALALIWLLVGYFSLLDLGMGRAMTKLTAEAIGLGKSHLLPRIFWTALYMMGALGLLGGLTLLLGADALATRRLSIPAELQSEVRTAFWIVSGALPFTIAVTGLIGMLETHQYFRLINLVRVPVGVATFLAPIAVLPFSHNLIPVVASLIGVRLLELTIYLYYCLRRIPLLRTRIRPDAAMIRPLLTFGGWLTVSNITLPIMLQIDRFIIGFVKTLANVSYYTIPSELVVKILILPRAWVSALFPPMTMHFAQKSPKADALFALAVKLLLLALFPAILLLHALAPEFLAWWIDPDFARVTAPLLRILSAGIFVYSLSYLAFSLLQSAGRPDRAALWHLTELLPFILAATWATRRWGITGMAVVWSLRCLLDALVLFPVALHYVPKATGAILRAALLTFLGLLALPLLSILPQLPMRLATAAALLVLFLLLAWPLLLNPTERATLLSRVPLLSHRRPPISPPRS